jgi:cytochrome c5
MMNRLFDLSVVVALMVCLGGCGETSVSAPETVTGVELVEDAVAAPLSQRQMQQWSNSCALCHVTGVAGAPVLGDAEQWGSRLVQGKDVLLAHTLEGFNSMPPLGYCMSCDTDDFSAMIDFMMGEPL